MKIVLILMLLAVAPLAAQTGAMKVSDELTLDAGVMALRGQTRLRFSSIVMKA